METVPRIAYYFLLQPQRYKIMESEAGERKSSCCWFILFLLYCGFLSSLSFILTQISMRCQFSSECLFSLCISIGNTLVLILPSSWVITVIPSWSFDLSPSWLPTCSCHIVHYSCHIDQPVNTKVYTWAT